MPTKTPTPSKTPAKAAKRPASAPTKAARPKVSTRARSKPVGPPALPQDVLDDLGQFKIKPLVYMLTVVNDLQAEPARRDRMAIAAAQYMHMRLRDGGKGEQREADAKAAVRRGRFSTMAEPTGGTDD